MYSDSIFSAVKNDNRSQKQKPKKQNKQKQSTTRKVLVGELRTDIRVSPKLTD